MAYILHTHAHREAQEGSKVTLLALNKRRAYTGIGNQGKSLRVLAAAYNARAY